MFIEPPPTLAQKAEAIRKRSRNILIALLFPTMGMILNISMFGVALPTIRDEFGFTSDVAAWLTIAFTLPFMMLMPLYGRLSDDLGKARLLNIGIVVFLLGTVLALLADNLAVLFLGRIIQGAGSSGITPVSMAIIAERFSPEERGRALGTWNSVGPGTAIFAPSIGGILVDSLGWRTIFVPAIIITIAALAIVRWQIPSLRGKPNWAVLRSFDWGGVLMLGGAITFLVLYISSRPVTGIEPLQDFRLIVVAGICATGFVTWERRIRAPLINLDILHNHNFLLASVTGALRMSMMIGMGFVLPLYLTDVYFMSASSIGLLATVHSISQFFFIRSGGPLADRLPNRWLIVGGMGLQVLVMAYFALLPGNVSLLWVVVGSIANGLGAGISLAAMHRTALSDIPDRQTGSAAGTYSMTRFAGSLLSTAMAGVLLQNRLDAGVATLTAYQIVYASLAVVGVFGILLASRLRN